MVGAIRFVMGKQQKNRGVSIVDSVGIAAGMDAVDTEERTLHEGGACSK